MNKKELIATIQTLGKFMKDDSSTFLWAKAQPNFASEKTEVNGSEYDIGGGNFVITLSALSIISLLAKIYKIVVSQNNDKLFDKNNVFINETSAVENLVQEVNNDIKIIDDPQNTAEYWKLMRHGLVHCFLPKKATSTIGAIGHLDFRRVDLNYYSYVTHLNQSISIAAVNKNDRGGYDCNADLLAVRAKQASDWLIRFVDAEYKSKHSVDINTLFGF